MNYTCTKCGQTLPESAFHVQRHSRTGKMSRLSYCRSCRNRQNYASLRKNNDRYAKKLGYDRQWSREHRPRVDPALRRKRRLMKALARNGLHDN